jgi:ribonuclease E
LKHSSFHLVRQEISIMGNKMLIDATHPEETRVVVMRGNRVEEFDYESAARKQLRGNIYLAKVARIEPSLQAAFVNYGGNRHGFLAFSEIHSDYYQIPVAVREALLKEDALDRDSRTEEGGNAAGESEAQPKFGAEEQLNAAAPGEGRSTESDAVPVSEAAVATAVENATAEQISGPIPLEMALPRVVYEEFSEALARGEEARDEIPAHPDDVEGAEQPAEHEDALPQAPEARNEEENGATHGERRDEAPGNWEAGSSTSEGGVISVPEAAAPTPVEVVGSEDALEEVPHRVKRRWRHYKIQEVIKRNQIVLVQVVKEERGTKGAALTTYLSLAGRYTVLMPNTASGGGISRKITVPADRKRLKEIAQELEVPEGMGLIIRTAGAARTKAEIKRDFEYLLRLWENVRDLTLKSTAPCLVYEEGDLIKRSIRDLYNKDIDEILVSGEPAYRDAKEFMRMLMPSHAKNVQVYKEPEPLFTKYEVERQLNQMFNPVVTLRSGGYIVVNQTEALVAIDVNSGRATREYSIEDTALKTNIEAAEEVARQVRLRDLAGLIVIDFIDMDERRNNRSVERRLKESLRHDRARIQVGHISHFGLLEMSRQRLRQGVVEVSTMPCPVCQGVGHIRSTESVSLMILRSIEDHLRAQGAANIIASCAPEAALYILNHKRAYLRDIETRYGLTIFITADDKARGAHFAIERGAEVTPPPAEELKVINIESASYEGEDKEDDAPAVAEEEDKRNPRRKRRRRRGRGDGGPDQPLRNGQMLGQHFESQSDAQESAGESKQYSGQPEVTEEQPQLADEAHAEAAEGAVSTGQTAGETETSEGRFRRNRRRGRRGGRRHREPGTSDEFTQPGYDGSAIPGLGEQPSVDFSHDFPHSNTQPAPAVDTVVEAPAVTEAEPASAAGVNAPEQPVKKKQPEHYGEPEQSIMAAPATKDPASESPVEPPVTEQAQIVAIVPGPAPAPAPAEIAVLVPPAPAPASAPKPKPVRTSPPRKGWWQRSIG